MPRCELRWFFPHLRHRRHRRCLGRKCCSSKLDDFRATIKVTAAFFTPALSSSSTIKIKKRQQQSRQASSNDRGYRRFLTPLQCRQRLGTRGKNVSKKLHKLRDTMQVLAVFFRHLVYHCRPRCPGPKCGSSNLVELCTSMKVTAAFFRTCVVVIVVFQDKKKAAANSTSFASRRKPETLSFAPTMSSCHRSG